MAPLDTSMWPTPTMAGTPIDRARIAVCDTADPTSVQKANAMPWGRLTVSDGVRSCGDDDRRHLHLGQAAVLDAEQGPDDLLADVAYVDGPLGEVLVAELGELVGQLVGTLVDRPFGRHGLGLDAFLDRVDERRVLEEHSVDAEDLGRLRTGAGHRLLLQP